MALYYKFKSVKQYESIPIINDNFISVCEIKQRIIETKHLDRGRDIVDLIITNAQTNEEYLDEAMLIPKNTSVSIRRIPWRPIVTLPGYHRYKPHVEASEPEHVRHQNSTFIEVGSSAMKYPEDFDWNDFGNDVYAIPEPLPVQTSNPIQDVHPPSKDEEDSKIKALIDTPALDWQRQTDGFGSGRGSERGISGRMTGGFGRGGFEQKIPPSRYVCHRCNQPGHFIQHCPTNGDPEYDVKRVRPPSGIPKNMLVATPEGSYALPNGAIAVLKPNEAAFEKEIEGMPASQSVGDFPPEFHCPLCKDVMKYSVVTGKCCFTSFCDKCIRDRIITKSICVCGANILADDLVPNKTLRDSISRILESSSKSSTGGSVSKISDMEIKMKHPQIEQKVPSLTNSEVSMRNEAPLPQIEESSMVKDAEAQGNVNSVYKNATDSEETGKVPDVSEGTCNTKTVNEHASQGNAPLAVDKVQQNPVSDDAGKKKKKKKKKKKIRAPLSEIHWRNPQDLAMENMMCLGPSAYNPYWDGMQPGMEGFFPSFVCPMPPFMGHGPGPLDVPFGLVPQDYFGVPDMMMPPQRNLSEIGIIGTNVGHPIMSREEFEAQKADLKKKHESQRRDERDISRDRECMRERSSNGDAYSQKPESLPPPISGASLYKATIAPNNDLSRTSSKDKSSDYKPKDSNHYHENSHHYQSESSARSRALKSPYQGKSSVVSAFVSEAETNHKQKARVFSRISFPEEDKATKKRKDSSPEHTSNKYNDTYKKKVAVKSASVEVNEELNEDEDRYFKRMRSRYD